MHASERCWGNKWNYSLWCFMRTLVYVWMWPHSWSHKYILVLILSPQNRFTTPFWSGSVRPQRVTYDPTAWPSTVSLSSILYSSPCLINVIPASLSINLYETGAQWLSKTNQSCCTAPLMNSRSLAQLEEMEKYRLEGGRHLCPFFYYLDAGVCSSSSSNNSGVSSGKI